MRFHCRACGQTAVWCSTYTGCSLNKGNAHSIVEDYPGQWFWHHNNKRIKSAENAATVDGVEIIKKVKEISMWPQAVHILRFFP